MAKNPRPCTARKPHISNVHKRHIKPKKAFLAWPEHRSLAADAQLQSPLCLSFSFLNYQQGQLDAVRGILGTKKKIVILNGAGISVNSGGGLRCSRPRPPTLTCSIVPAFGRSMRHIFDISTFQTEDSTRRFLAVAKELWQQCSSATTSPFHRYIGHLAQQGRLLRQYSQNVDWIEDKLSSLSTAEKAQAQKSEGDSPRMEINGPWPSTIHLHGRLDLMRCHKCGASFPTTAELLQGPSLPLCPACHKANECRLTQGKRVLSLGRLRPDILLYGEESLDQDAIGCVCANDIRARSDAVLIVGTKLNVPGAKRLAIELCQSVRASSTGRATIWISKDPPPSTHQHLFDVVFIGDCDDVVGMGAF